jgi:glycosyltransferase involved in cell wall biosynthesis
VPTRNRQPLLARAVASIEAQRLRDFELIVADDGSTDGTGDWLRTRPDVRVVTSPHPVGAAAARNLALERARGELVAFLDDDDVWQPSYLDAQVAQLDAFPDAVMSYTGHIECDAEGRTFTPTTRTLLPGSTAILRLLTENPIHTMSVVVCRRDAFMRFGGFDESLAIVHDLDWYARVVVGGGRIVHEPRPLVEHTIPGGLVTSYRQWFQEERAVHSRVLAESGEQRHARLVRTYRSLFFAKRAVAQRDLTFAAARVGDALLTSPYWSVRLVYLSLLRRAPRNRLARASGATVEIAP